MTRVSVNSHVWIARWQVLPHRGSWISFEQKTGSIDGILIFTNHAAVQRDDLCAGLLGLRTLVFKMIGVVCSMAGGLIAGKEGPFIHAGNALMRK